MKFLIIGFFINFNIVLSELVYFDSNFQISLDKPGIIPLPLEKITPKEIELPFKAPQELILVTVRKPYRFPSEVREEIEMGTLTIKGKTRYIAYFRDVWVGWRTDIEDASGEIRWDTRVILPSGKELQFSPPEEIKVKVGNKIHVFSSGTALIFSEDIDGKGNPGFATDKWYTSGTRKLSLIWYVQDAKRLYPKIHFCHYLLPQIEHCVVPTYNQGDERWANDTLGEGEKTIKRIGCALTSAAGVLSYHGFVVDPGSLNTWLKNNKGYQKNNIKWWELKKYVKEIHKSTFIYGGKEPKRKDEFLEKQIALYGPQIIEVKGRQHFVVTTGRDLEQTTWLINDPDGGTKTTLDARYKGYESMRLFRGPEYKWVDKPNRIRIFFFSPGSILLIDPLGRKVGYDPRIDKIYSDDVEKLLEEEEGMVFYRKEEDDEGEPLDLESAAECFIDIADPVSGIYELLVIGTETGKYQLFMDLIDNLDNDVEVNIPPDEESYIPIKAKEIHRYFFYYDEDDVKRNFKIIGPIYKASVTKKPDKI